MSVNDRAALVTVSALPTFWMIFVRTHDSFGSDDRNEPTFPLMSNIRCVLIDTMFSPKHNLKNDPEKRWNQSDRVFFGFGACHILAGTFLKDAPLDGFYGEWIVPIKGYSGTHMYVTNGLLAFDFHGYSFREKLLARYWKGHQSRYLDWNATIERIDFPLLDTHELNKRKHLGPDQYFADPIPRARKFITSITVPTKFSNSFE